MPIAAALYLAPPQTSPSMMFSPSAMDLLAMLVLFIVGAALFWPPKTRHFARKGWEPGYWDLKVWPARIYFFLRGHDVAETAYNEVLVLSSCL
jgi:hypothetical protein